MCPNLRKSRHFGFSAFPKLQKTPGCLGIIAVDLGRWVAPTRLVLWGQNPSKDVVSRAEADKRELYQALSSQVKILSPFLTGKLCLAQHTIHNMIKVEDFQTIFFLYPEEKAAAPEVIK